MPFRRACVRPPLTQNLARLQRAFDETKPVQAMAGPYCNVELKYVTPVLPFAGTLRMVHLSSLLYFSTVAPPSGWAKGD